MCIEGGRIGDTIDRGKLLFSRSWIKQGGEYPVVVDAVTGARVNLSSVCIYIYIYGGELLRWREKEEGENVWSLRDVIFTPLE